MSTAYEVLVDALRDAGSRVTDNGHGKAEAQCPAHDDRKASLGLRSIEGSVLVCCRASCDTADVLATLGMTKADLYDSPRGMTFTYPDRRVVHRSPDKTFRQTGNTHGRALFHADRITADDKTVYVPEGEKDVLAIEAAGGVAVCNAMGAGKAHLFDWSVLREKQVFVIADKDTPGRRHAAEVAELVREAGAASVCIVEAVVGKDAADHIAASYSLDDLVRVDEDPAVVDGATFILDQPHDVAANWGKGSEVLWAEGEPVMIAGPLGLGKTTLGGLLVRAQLGIGDGLVLNLPVKRIERPILYLAMDRPRQIARSLARQFSETDRDILRERLIVRKGPPPADLAAQPLLLLGLAQRYNAGVVYVDSLKDAALGLSKDEVLTGRSPARETT